MIGALLWQGVFYCGKKIWRDDITSFKMSPSSLGGGKQTTTDGEHISQLVETLIGRFFF